MPIWEGFCAQTCLSNHGVQRFAPPFVRIAHHQVDKNRHHEAAIGTCALCGSAWALRQRQGMTVIDAHLCT